MTSSSPLVSVVMPAYNAKDCIGAAIESVLNQDYPNLELIIVDDGSTDGTVEEALRYRTRVRVLRQTNSGPAAARNRGVSSAEGELIAFIDADDIWKSDKTSTQVAYLAAHPEVGVVFGRLIRWFANDDGSFGPIPEATAEEQRAGIVPEESGWIYPEMLLDSVIWIVSAMVRRSLWDVLGGLDPTLRIGEDYDFFIRASRQTKMDELDRVVAYYRIHKQSTTHVMRVEDIEYAVLLRAIEKYGTAAPDGREVSPQKLRGRLFQLCFRHGYRHYWHGSPQVAARAFLAATRYNKFSLKAWGYYLISLAKQGQRSGIQGNN